MTNSTLEMSLTVRFEEKSRRSERTDVLSDIENGVFEVLDTGQNVYSGDGAFYNLMESFDVSVKNRDSVLRIEVEFEEGTGVNSMNELVEDLTIVLEEMMVSDNDIPERKCYEQVLTYSIDTKFPGGDLTA